MKELAVRYIPVVLFIGASIASAFLPFPVFSLFFSGLMLLFWLSTVKNKVSAPSAWALASISWLTLFLLYKAGPQIFASYGEDGLRIALLLVWIVLAVVMMSLKKYQ